ncbi:MAG: leucine-rich repeat domain-containing protein, partial [Gemmatimonadetes bacterium]|nr:leucine-rich repeat domain-containing protein [Gemmatimonadota bacterium]
MKSLIGVFIGLLLSVSVGAEPLIEGRVRLDSGESVADAQVQIFDLADLRRGAIVRATTDATGYFALPLAALGGSARPTSFTLGPNYPNPFNPSTIIPYQLAASSQVRLEVFNLLGQRIATLVDGARPAGFHTAQWHATDAAGRAVAAGVYIYRMTVGAERQTGRMVLVDGQAGVAAAGTASAGLGAARGESDGASEQAYGLVVSGEGLAPYVDSAFRAQAGRGPVEWVVEALGAVPAKVSVRPAGLLGDVNNDNQVNSSDALLVVAYSAHAALAMPNNGNILLGDVNQDGQINSTDAQLIASKAVQTADVIAIPDANLRAAIEAALGKASGAPITNDEMATLTALKAPDAGIRDLTGLEFAINLETLWLKDNAISDVSSLSGLTNLTWLWLDINQITDISPLSGLTNLTRLWLGRNDLSDISPLSGLTNLEVLYLGNNAITDISPLSGLTNLTRLDLWDNAITDISPLSGLTHLEVLYLWN